MVEAKICGVISTDAVVAAAKGGSRFVGFVFYAPSPRNLTIEAARTLASVVPPSIQKVGLFVDATNEAITQVLNEVPLDFLQLHGEESPSRIKAIRERFGLPVMKAIRIGARLDIEKAASYQNVADRMLYQE